MIVNDPHERGLVLMNFGAKERDCFVHDAKVFFDVLLEQGHFGEDLILIDAYFVHEQCKKLILCETFGAASFAGT